MKTNIFKITAIMLLVAGSFWLFSCEKPDKTKTSIQHLETVLGGCNNGLSGRGGDIEEKDTVNISVSDDSIHVFVGLNYTCKGSPFQTKVETIDNVIYMYIEDKCYDSDNNEIDCGYARCYCYYTFDFAFHYEGEINQKYKILLYGSPSVGGEHSESVISEGVISRDKEPEVPVGSTDLQGTWKVKAISIEGVMTNIDSIREDSPNDALYPDISITIPSSAQGYIEGHTFYSMIEFDFEIMEYQQIHISNYVEYVENELLIQFEQGVDAAQFAMNCTYKITPKRLLSDKLNIWLFETDGTEKLRVIISDLSQNANVKYVQFNHSGITPREEVIHFQKNILNAVKFDVSKDELKFLDSQDNPVIIFIKTREL